MKKNILIFSYDGPHKKSEDLFYISQKKNLNIKMVVLNPWEYLKKKTILRDLKVLLINPQSRYQKFLINWVITILFVSTVKKKK